MELKSEKKELIKRLEQVNDLSLIQAIKHMLDFGLKHTGERVTIAQYNEELDRAEAEMEGGNFIGQDDLKEQMKKW